MGRATVLTALVLCAALPTLGCAARGPAGAPSAAPALAPTPPQAFHDRGDQVAQAVVTLAALELLPHTVKADGGRHRTDAPT